MSKGIIGKYKYPLPLDKLRMHRGATLLVGEAASKVAF